MPKIKFDSEWLKAGVNVVKGDKIRFLDAGTQDKDKRWIFVVAVISGKTGNVRSQKKFSLNKVNFNSIASFYGGNSDDWVGKEMAIDVRMVDNPRTGEAVQAVRLIGQNDVVNENLDDLEDVEEIGETEENFLE